MRKALAVLVFLASVVLAVYLGLWVWFVGGIEEIVDALNKHPIPSGPIAWGIVKITFCGMAIFITYIGFALAAIIWTEGRPSSRNWLSKLTRRRP